MNRKTEDINIYILPLLPLLCSDLSVSRRPGETGRSDGADHDPLGGAGDGLHSVGGQTAQQLRPAVLVLGLASPLSCHVAWQMLGLSEGGKPDNSRLQIWEVFMSFTASTACSKR